MFLGSFFGCFSPNFATFSHVLQHFSLDFGNFFVIFPVKQEAKTGGLK